MDTNNHIVTNEELASAFGGAVPQTPVASSNNGAGIPDKQAKKPTKKQKWDKLTIAYARNSRFSTVS